VNQILVYGSLKRGERLHYALEDAIYVGPGKINGTLFDLGPYPAAVAEYNPEKTCGEITGEIYTVGPKIMQRLDRIESHPVYYERRPVKELTTGKDVWVYLLPKERLPLKADLIANGFWTGQNNGKGIQYAR